MSTEEAIFKIVHCPRCGEKTCRTIDLTDYPILLGGGEEKEISLKCPVCEKDSDYQIKKLKELPDCKMEEGATSCRDMLSIEILREHIKRTFEVLDEAAKQLMTACSFLLTVYVFLLDNFVKRASGPLPSPLLRYMVPPIGLLAAFVIPLIVTLYPWPYSVLLNAPEEAQKAIQNAQKRKLMGIWAATAIFLISVIIMLMVVLKS